VKVGDLIQILDYARTRPGECGGPSSVGIICKIEKVYVRGAPEQDVIRYWTMWTDGEYAWISEEDSPEIINEGR